MPVQTGPEAEPANCTMGMVSFVGVKRPGRGADHQPPSGSTLLLGWSYMSAFPLCLHRHVMG